MYCEKKNTLSYLGLDPRPLAESSVKKVITYLDVASSIFLLLLKSTYFLFLFLWNKVKTLQPRTLKKTFASKQQQTIATVEQTPFFHKLSRIQPRSQGLKYRVMQHNMPVTQHNIHVFLPNIVSRDEEQVWIPQLNADTAVQQAAYFCIFFLFESSYLWGHLHFTKLYFIILAACTFLLNLFLENL